MAGLPQKWPHRDTELLWFDCWGLNPERHVAGDPNVRKTGMTTWRCRSVITGSMTWVMYWSGRTWKLDLKLPAISIQTSQTIGFIPERKTLWACPRWWFACPRCQRRCAVLYLIPNPGLFRCRLCGGVTYQSKQERSQNEYLRSIGYQIPRYTRIRL